MNHSLIFLDGKHPGHKRAFLLLNVLSYDQIHQNHKMTVSTNILNEINLSDGNTIKMTFPQKPNLRAKT